MRIGMDARLLYAEQLKGVGRYLQHLLNHLVSSNGGHEYVLFYDPAHVALDRAPRHARLTAVAVTARNDELWEQWALPRAIRAASVDLFHSPANTTMLRSPCPVVVTLHDAMSHQAAPGWGRRENFYWNGIQRWAYRRVPRFVTPTVFAKQQLVDVLGLPARKISVVYHGISDVYQPAAPEAVRAWRRRYGIEAPYLFTAGGRLPRKNVPTLLRAFDAAARQMPEVLLAVSSVKGVPEIEGLRGRLDARSRIHLLPHLDETDLVPAYSGAELFVFPSLRETFGFPPLEAMACGAPVVASNATCIPEVVGDGAYLVDCARPEPLAQAMLEVLGDAKLRAQLKGRGQARVKQFQWERAAQQTLAVYGEAMSS